MVRSRDVVQAEGSARTEGARRATGVPADGAAAGAGSLAPGQRWSASRKRDVVLRLLRGESLEALSREAGVEIYRLDAWREPGHGWPRTRLKGSSRRASGGGARRGEASHRGAVDGDRAPARAGAGGGAAPPFGDAEVATMSATTSAATRRCFGIQRVCQVWERSRSALYARRARAHHRLGGGPARRGPAPRQSDAQLLAAIRTDLARSPFHGEGHRKVHARLRILDGIRVARTRVLRVMRAHGLLSPHRGRQGAAKTHDGRVITQAPNVMWGTDGVRVFTLDDGWGWIFAAVEHWNAECVGWHVCKAGSRFAALDRLRKGSNVSMARWTPTSPVGWRFGWITVVSTCQTTSSSRSGIGGSTPASALSRNRKRTVWRSGGIVRSRSKRSTGRIFQNLEAVRAAVADFVERYNQTWRLEKLGYHTPIEAREEYELRQAA